MIYFFHHCRQYERGRGLEKVTDASEISINMTNNHDLFTNYGLFSPCSIFILKRAIINTTGNRHDRLREYTHVYSFTQKK